MVEQIAQIYSVSRQNLRWLRINLGVTYQAFLDPHLIFQKLLTARSSPLRSRLSDPAYREQIEQALKSQIKP